MPLLILNKRDVPNSEVLRFIGEGEHVNTDQRVTIITFEGNDSEIESWCRKDREQRKHVRRLAMTGCEDDVIITFDYAFHEELTRAREMLIMVAEPGS